MMTLSWGEIEKEEKAQTSEKKKIFKEKGELLVEISCRWSKDGTGNWG